MLTRRKFIVTAAGASAVTAAAVYAGAVGAVPAAAAPKAEAGLRTFINGASIERARVVEWEQRRIFAASARLSADYADLVGAELNSFIKPGAVAIDDIAAARAALGRARARIGMAGLREMLATEIASSEAVTSAAVAASGGRWAISSTEIVSDQGSAEGFRDWFDRARVTDNQTLFTDACPDHYIIDTAADGRQEVLEVTGGAVLVSRFFVDYTDLARVVVPADPDYPLAIAGTAWQADGQFIGSVRHQLRNEPGGGFRAKLGVAFPAAVPDHNISEHRWHLACEFSNWVIAYLS